MQTSHNILQISVNKINEIIFIKLQEIKSIQNSNNCISKKTQIVSFYLQWITKLVQFT